MFLNIKHLYSVFVQNRGRVGVLLSLKYDFFQPPFFINHVYATDMIPIWPTIAENQHNIFFAKNVISIAVAPRSIIYIFMYYLLVLVSIKTTHSIIIGVILYLA